MRSLDALKTILLQSGVKNGEQIAKELFEKFHTLDRIVCADPDQLSAMLGDRCAMLIKLLGALSSRRATDKFVFGTRPTELELKDYLISLFRGCSVETLYVISMTATDKVIACDYVGEGTVNAAVIIPRKILEIAMRRGASGVIIAHNHPGGTPNPSSEDVLFTTKVMELFNNAGIKLKKHYTVAGSRCDEIMCCSEK